MCQVIAGKFEDWIACRLPDGWMVYASALYTPEEHGYQDRTVNGLPDHGSSILEAPDGERLLVDWSASQYGYNEIPLVQRSLAGEPFEREFARPVLSSDSPEPLAELPATVFEHPSL
jgi:hypothetical protein